MADHIESQSLGGGRAGQSARALRWVQPSPRELVLTTPRGVFATWPDDPRLLARLVRPQEKLGDSVPGSSCQRPQAKPACFSQASASRRLGWPNFVPRVPDLST
jgi:hypothetical protein